MKRWLGGGIIVLLLGVMVWSLSIAAERIVPRKADTLAKADAGNDPLIVHEWGTFTSYSGSDGGRLEFRPLFDDDLPHFVNNRSQGGLWLSKSSYGALVRMETPVTYFYTDKPRDVRVRVDFPKGLLTEFYPPVASVSPPFQAGKPEPKANSSLDWGTIRLLPESSLLPQVGDERLAKEMQRRIVEALPPHTDYNNHYKYARQTDSALVHFHKKRAASAEETIASDDHFEKFLFYRGLGDFKLPIKVTALGDGLAHVENNGPEAIVWMMLLDVNGEAIRYASFDGVAAAGNRNIKLPAEVSDVNHLAADLTEALTSTGLYRKEAEAMVNTWRSSWFSEQGTRLLYFVPQSLTEELLPLTVEPKPAETIRVLVGRLDLMTPEQEASITKLVAESAAARTLAYQTARETETAANYLLPDNIRKLGRLAEPALTRVRHITKDDQVHYEAGYLISQLRDALAAEQK